MYASLLISHSRGKRLITAIAKVRSDTHEYSQDILSPFPTYPNLLDIISGRTQVHITIIMDSVYAKHRLSTPPVR
jgi:hypothetical protein